MMRRFLFSAVVCLTIGVVCLFCHIEMFAQTIDRQAEQQARDFWNARITKCGDEYYTQDRIYIHQFKNPRIEVRARQLSSADRANGIEYIGFTSYKVELSRTYSPKATLYLNPGWSKWSNGFTGAMGGVGLDASVRKENGRWNVTPSQSSQAVVIKSIDCSNLSDMNQFYDESPTNTSTNNTPKPSNAIQIEGKTVRIEVINFVESDGKSPLDLSDLVPEMKLPTTSTLEFLKNYARFISWVIIVKVKPRGKISNNLKAVWYKSDKNGNLQKWSEQTGGTVQITQSGIAFIGSKGWSVENNWQSGGYKVEIFEGEKLIAMREFGVNCRPDDLNCKPD